MNSHGPIGFEKGSNIDTSIATFCTNTNVGRICMRVPIAVKENICEKTGNLELKFKYFYDV